MRKHGRLWHHRITEGDATSIRMIHVGQDGVVIVSQEDERPTGGGGVSVVFSAKEWAEIIRVTEP